VRIVTLLPSATEIVGAIAPLDAIVAVSHECDYPIGIASRPRITSSIIPHGLNAVAIDRAVNQAVQEGRALYQVDGDLLAKLKPDLIVTQGLCDVCAVNINTVEETLRFLPDALPEGAQILSLSGQNFAGVLRDIERVGAAIGHTKKAAEVIAGLRQRWRKLARSIPQKKPTVLMLEWPDPPFYGGHWVPEMVAFAGGIDVLGQAGQDSKRCSWAEISGCDPDVIVAIACGQTLEQNMQLMQKLYDHPEFVGLRATHTDNVWAVDANSYFSRPAPRIVDGTELLRQILHHPSDDIPGARRVLKP
jgi:iron complex transport system substrate-binding protein